MSIERENGKSKNTSVAEIVLREHCRSSTKVFVSVATIESESFLLSVSWILFVFNISFYLHCRECPWRIFLIVELVVSRPQRKLLFLLRYILPVLRSFSYTVEGSRTNKGKYLLFFRTLMCDSGMVLSFISVTAFSLLGKSTDREKICADNTTRIHLSRFTAFFVVKNVQIQGGGVHAVHVRTKGGCWNLTFDSEDSPYMPASNIASSHILHKSVHVATNHC